MKTFYDGIRLSFARCLLCLFALQICGGITEAATTWYWATTNDTATSQNFQAQRSVDGGAWFRVQAGTGVAGSQNPHYANIAGSTTTANERWRVAIGVNQSAVVTEATPGFLHWAGIDSTQLAPGATWNGEYVEFTSPLDMYAVFTASGDAVETGTEFKVTVYNHTQNIQTYFLLITGAITIYEYSIGPDEFETFEFYSVDGPKWASWVNSKPDWSIMADYDVNFAPSGVGGESDLAFREYGSGASVLSFIHTIGEAVLSTPGEDGIPFSQPGTTNLATEITIQEGFEAVHDATKTSLNGILAQAKQNVTASRTINDTLELIRVINADNSTSLGSVATGQAVGNNYLSNLVASGQSSSDSLSGLGEKIDTSNARLSAITNELATIAGRQEISEDDGLESHLTQSAITAAGNADAEAGKLKFEELEDDLTGIAQEFKDDGGPPAPGASDYVRVFNVLGPNGVVQDISIDFNPMHNELIADLAEWVSAILAWLSAVAITGLVTGRMFEAVGKLGAFQQGFTKRVRIQFAGTDVLPAWATWPAIWAVTKAVLFAAIFLLPAWFSSWWYTSNPDIMSTIAGNPFTSSSVVLQLGLFVLFSFVPIGLMLFHAVLYLAFNSALTAYMYTIQVIVRSTPGN